MTKTENPIMGVRIWFGKLSSGDFGLAKTYWLYLILNGVLINAVTNLITSFWILSIVMPVWLVYHSTVLLGTWRAAEKYYGFILWSILAKIVVVLNGLLVLLLAGYALELLD